MPFKKGYTPWNKGLTSETDFRVAVASARGGLSRKGRAQTAEANRKRSLSLRGRVQPEERNRRRSEFQTRRILEGNFRPQLGKPELATFIKGGEVYCRSQLEVQYGRLLDADPSVVEFLHEKVKVKYFYDGKQRWTVIDFLVKYATGLVTLDEVKPEWVVKKDLRTRVKMRAAEAFAKECGLVYRWWDGKVYRALES